MPDSSDRQTYRTMSNVKELDGQEGSFTCNTPSGNNYGPVKVDRYYHFRSAEDKFYSCMGTTSYTWIHQPEELADQTLKTLIDSPFNKVRMTVFPKSYIYNENEPDCYVFPLVRSGRAPGTIIGKIRDVQLNGIDPCPERMSGLTAGWKSPDWIIGYTGVRQPVETISKLPVGKIYTLQYIDTWDMTITTAKKKNKSDSEETTIPLPGKAYTAFLLTADI